MKIPEKIAKWLLSGDVAIQFQTYRDLLGEDKLELQHRIALEGWGKQFLDARKPDGHWGDRFYQPKWKSTHYTLLDLRNLNLDPTNNLVKESINKVALELRAEDGGIQLGPSTSVRSDVCVNGMFLNYASYFKTKKELLKLLIDCLLSEHMHDGGFNCRTTRSGAKHSSLHSTISVLEGFETYLQNAYSYRKEEVLKAQTMAEEFILQHQLYLSDRTGEIIHPAFLKFPFPSRWKYDVLRSLDYFQFAERSFEPRMTKALDHLKSKQTNDGSWKVNAAHAGQVHFTMDKAGQASRWNTLRALRVLKKYS